MGLFGFLKKQEPPITLKVGEVESWLKSYQDSLGLDHHFSIFLSEMRMHIKHILERLDILSEAKLLNDGLAPRVRQIMEGHRKQFIKRMEDFVNNIEVPKEYELLHAFAEQFSLDVEQLNKETQKNVFVLREFFEKETFEVAKNIGKIDRSIADLRSTFNRLGKENVDLAYKALREYHEVLSKREELEKALLEEQEKLEEPAFKLKKINEKITHLQSSNNYRFIQEAKEEKETVAQDVLAEKELIRKMTTSLIKPLQKFLYKHPDVIAQKYVKNFSDGLLADEELCMVKYLDEFEKAIDTLDLKPSQVKNAQSTLKKVSLAWLNARKKKLVSLLKKDVTLKDRLSKDTTRLLLDEQFRWQKATQEHLDDLEKNMSMVKNELERLSPRLYLQKVRDALKNIKSSVDLEMK